MLKPHDSRAVKAKVEDLMKKIRKQCSVQDRVACEWPYIAGSTCLLVLLVWQPLRQPSLTQAFAEPDAQQATGVSYAAQRSLQQIDTSCTERVVDEHCGQECGVDKATSAQSGREYEFSRSLLTCVANQAKPSQQAETDKPHNLMIEVIKSNHSF